MSKYPLIFLNIPRYICKIELPIYLYILGMHDFILHCSLQSIIYTSQVQINIDPELKIYSSVTPFYLGKTTLMKNISDVLYILILCMSI